MTRSEGIRRNGSEKDFSQYEDMLYLKRPVSRSHLPMDIMDRAAQFSPFAALTGYGDAVKGNCTADGTKQELDDVVREGGAG